MIQKCQTTTLTKKRFSDFELIDPTTKKETDQLFLAGYIEQEDGTKKNVKLYADAFLNIKVGDTVPDVKPGDSNDSLSVIPDWYKGNQVQLVTINFQSSVDFLQINNVPDSMWTIINGKQYLCIKLSSNFPLGSVYRLYFPNFPFNRGVALFPRPDVPLSADEPIEVFYNVKQRDEEVQTSFDYYVTLIQLADPTSPDAGKYDCGCPMPGDSEILLKTKIVSVQNIESF